MTVELTEVGPVSYTHLDVYKRQVYAKVDVSMKVTMYSIWKLLFNLEMYSIFKLWKNVDIDI